MRLKVHQRSSSVVHFFGLPIRSKRRLSANRLLIDPKFEVPLRGK